MKHSLNEMSGEQFWKTVVAGLIANYVMTMTGFWQSGLGLATIDVGAMIAGSMTAAHPDAPYTLVVGNLVHFANGVILALIWVTFLQKRVPGELDRAGSGLCPYHAARRLGDRGPAGIWCGFVFHEHACSRPDDDRDPGRTRCIWALAHVEP